MKSFTKYFCMTATALTLAAFSFHKAEAACVEVSMSTCVGDFADGGDDEEGQRLLGNTSGYSLLFIQNNKVRIGISSGTDSGQVSSSPLSGFVGIHYDFINKFPQYQLDVNGMIRSTGSAFIATTWGGLAVGRSTVTPGSMIDSAGVILSTAFHGDKVVVSTVNAWQVNASSANISTITATAMTLNGTLYAYKLYGDGSNLSGITVTASTSAHIANFRASTVSAASNIIAASMTSVDVQGCMFHNVSSQVNISLLGAGGVSPGDVQDGASRWYVYGLIADNTCSNVGMMATSWVNQASPKAMPQDRVWTKWRPLGLAYNDGSQNLLGFEKRGNYVNYMTKQSILNSASPASVVTNLSAAAAVSTAAVSALFHVEAIGSATTTIYSMAGVCNSLPATDRSISAGAASTTMGTLIEVPVCHSDPTLFKYVTTNVATNIEVNVRGYREIYP